MIAIVLFCLFIALGIYLTRLIFYEENVLIQGWMGAMVGLLAFMWLVVVFSFIFSFGYLSHLFSLLTLLVIIYIFKKCLPKPSCNSVESPYKYTPHILFTVVLSILIFILLFTHIIYPKDDGWYGGQSTYGDLSLHLGIITNITTQKVFPPEYSILPGARLGYPFLVDSLSSSFLLMGLNLRWAVLLPSIFLVILLILGFLLLAQEKLNSAKMALIAAVLFFFNGGFGFIYFMDGLKSNPENFTRIFSEFYKTPTNYVDQNIYWANIICDLIIPQRTTLAGWTFLFFVVFLLERAISKSNKKYFLLAGITTGLMPMIHTHSFLALGMVVITWFIVYFWGQGDKACYIKNWLYFVVPVIILALPQLLYWTFPQSIENTSSFLRFKFNWSNRNDIWIWFWVKNVGVVFILVLPALFSANKKLLKFYSPAIVIFLIAEFFVFQPNLYDNNKLFYIWYAFSTILVSWFVLNLINTINRGFGKIIAIALLILFSSFSALLSIGREYTSSYQLFDSHKIAAYNFIKDNTPKDALFLSATFHNNPVSALAGRKVLCGPSIYLFFHGLDYQKREEDVRRMYQDSVFFEKQSKKYGIDYLYLSSYERRDYKADSGYYDQRYSLVFQSGDIRIYAISERAKNPKPIDP